MILTVEQLHQFFSQICIPSALNYRTMEIQCNILVRKHKDKGKQKTALNILSILPSPENNSVLTSPLNIVLNCGYCFSVTQRDKAIMIKDLLVFFPGYMAHLCGRLTLQSEVWKWESYSNNSKPSYLWSEKIPGIFLSLQPPCTEEEWEDKVSISLLLWIRGLGS